ncbi:hypothetical protein NE237_026962 [Protea cynaroides]|uniref:SPARK domain-containing protein n=1 Tax=Protea cynaroides TaxID=273540 RepID=A0A9Q0GMH4_9MAGN|nr:hypothetical protein NE237_026962 [Protea cynaroides]
MKLQYGFLFLKLVSFLTITAPNSVSPSTTNISSCPMDLGYVQTMPWDSSACKNYNNGNRRDCCQTLLSVYGIAFPLRLKDTSLFQLPDLNTSEACLHDFQSKLDFLSHPSDLASSCLKTLNGSSSLLMSLQESKPTKNGLTSSDPLHI